MGLKLSFEKIMQKDDSKRVTRAESSISQLASEIALRVTQETFNGLDDSVSDAWAELALQAAQISSKVSQTDYNGNTIASLINQTADQVTIQANRIKLEGLVTANNNFKVLPDGSIEAVNAKLSGAITATRVASPTNQNYYGEIGITDEGVGFGLFDLRFGNEAFFEVLETVGGNGFIIRDKNNNTRFEATQNITRINSPNRNFQFSVTDEYVSIVKNGSTIAIWRQ